MGWRRFRIGPIATLVLGLCLGVMPGTVSSVRADDITHQDLANRPAELSDGLKAFGKEDYATALRLLRPFADQGAANAQNALGNMYREGLGVPKDYVQAVKWYRLAAEQGYAYAQTNLGYMYDDGLGVPKDYVQAAKWYRLAADKGDAYSQAGLGYLFEIGKGEKQDLSEAQRLYRLSARQGYPAAQIALARILLVNRTQSETAHLCEIKSQCRIYVTERMGCATAGQYKDCMNIRMGDRNFSMAQYACRVNGEVVTPDSDPLRANNSETSTPREFRP